MPDGLRPPFDVNDGKTCSDMLGALPLVQWRFVKAGWIKEDFSGLVMQWSGRSDVSASASTHRSGGVFDVAYSLVNSDAKLRVWQQCGFTPFARFPPKFPYHGHVLVNGCSHLHWSAANQITSARRGRDGLKSNGPYPGPTDVPYRTWQRAQVLYADEVEELNMPTPREIAAAVLAYPIDEHDHDLRWGIDSIREGMLRIGPRTSEINDKVDELLAATEAINKGIVELRADLAEEPELPPDASLRLPSPAEE